ncbi:hypothetical protein H1R20_g7302, partial [Candolleomyces eurysporus]
MSSLTPPPATLPANIYPAGIVEATPTVFVHLLLFEFEDFHTTFFFLDEELEVLYLDGEYQLDELEDLELEEELLLELLELLLELELELFPLDDDEDEDEEEDDDDDDEELVLPPRLVLPLPPPPPPFRRSNHPRMRLLPSSRELMKGTYILKSR